MFFSSTRIRKHWIPAVAFSLFEAIACAEVPEESGLPLVQNYTMRDYRAHNQVWRCVQDTRGVLYFGNRGVGRLEVLGPPQLDVHADVVWKAADEELGPL
jgi:hypothetical protein